MNEPVGAQNAKDITDRLFRRWENNDTSIEPVKLYADASVKEWRLQVQTAFIGRLKNDTSMEPQALLKIFSEAWSMFRNSRGRDTKTALLTELRVKGQTGQAWVADMMCLVRFQGTTTDENTALNLLAETVGLATRFTRVGTYSNTIVFMLSRTLEQLVNAIIIESSEEEQMSLMNITNQTNFDYADHHLVRKFIVNALDESETEPAYFNGKEQIEGMCEQILLGCSKVLQGLENVDPDRLSPATIEKIATFFDQSFFWAYRALPPAHKVRLENTINVDDRFTNLAAYAGESYRDLVKSVPVPRGSEQGMIARLWNAAGQGAPQAGANQYAFPELMGIMGDLVKKTELTLLDEEAA